MRNDETKRPTNVSRAGTLDSVRYEIKKANALMRKLDSIFKRLPTLSGKDDPQCASAEDLYAQKQEAEDELAVHLKYISPFQDTIQNFIDKQKKKNESLSIDKTSLKYEKAINQYSFSIHLQEQKILEAMTIQKEFLMVMNSGPKTIKLAKTKKFPGGKPKRKSPIYPIGPFSSRPNDPSPIIPDMPTNKPIPPTDNNTIMPPIPEIQPISPIDNHINNLVSIGPLGK